MKSKRTWIKWTVLSLSGFVFFIALWYLTSFLMQRGGNYLLPYPHQVFAALGDILFLEGASRTYTAVGWTIARLLIGFSFSFVLGAIAGTLAGLFPGFGHFSSFFVGFARTIPTAAVVLVLVGVFYAYKGLPPYIPCFLVFLIAFPIIFEAFKSGIEAEPKDTIDALRLEGEEKGFHGVIDVYWPDSSSYILLAIAQSLGLSMKVSVMSEIIVNSSEANGGIGGLIQSAELYLDMKYVIAYSLVAVIIIVIIDVPLQILKKHLGKKLSSN